MLDIAARRSGSPVHGPDPIRVLLTEVRLHTQSRNGANIINGVHSHHPCVLQCLLAASNVGREDATLDDPSNDERRDDGNHKERHDPGVDEGDDKSQHKRGQSLDHRAQSTPSDLQTEVEQGNGRDYNIKSSDHTCIIMYVYNPYTESRVVLSDIRFKSLYCITRVFVQPL